MLLLLIIFKLFWQEKTPHVILAALIFQWLTISIGYIYMMFSGIEHEKLLRRPFYAIDNINSAYWLSIIGLLVFSIGLKLSINKLNFKQPKQKLIQQYNTTKIIIFYIIFSIASDIIFKTIRYSIPGLAQPANILTYFKWSIFFFMIYISFSKKEQKNIVIIIISIEIIIGFSGFFSTFKDIFFMFPIAYLAFNKLKLKQNIIITIIAIIAFNIGIVWTYVKTEQRLFLSGGQRTQNVTVSKTDALKNLYSLTSKFNTTKYNIGLTGLIQRIYYIEYFSATIKNIPKNKPYFNGEIWKNAIEHILKPRILFPNKKTIDDSEQTKKLTGINLSGAKHGTSISIGYMAESYADFGPYYMFIAIFILGFTTGIIYKTLYKTAINQLWRMAIIFPMFFIININGINTIKITGQLFMFLIIFYPLNKFITPTINKIISK